MGSMELTTDKVYALPKDLAKVDYEGNILIINKQGCNWLVLNQKTYEIFTYLQNGNSIERALEEYDQELVFEVLTQIEAKEFEHTVTETMEEQGLFVYLTNRCNLRCKHCYMYSGEVNLDELEQDSWFRILEDFCSQGIENVTFSGGEVLVYPYWREILQKAKELGYQVTVLSNGILWSEEDVALIASSINEIQFSLDGYDEDSYESIRGYRGFQKVLHTVDEFLKRDVRVSIAVTPLYDELDTFIERFTKFAKGYLKEHPTVYIKFNMELIEGREVHISEEKNREYKAKVRAMVEDIYPGFFEDSFATNFDGRKRVKNCGYGGITIASDGKVYWCNRIMEMDCEMSIHKNSVSDIMKRAAELKKSTSVEQIEPCRSCAIKYICGGKCRLKYKKNQEGVLSVECTKADKERLYQKMIVSNEYFFSE